MRAGIEHEVSHDAKKLTFLQRFQHIRRWPPTSAGKSRCLAVNILNHISQGKSRLSISKETSIVNHIKP